MKFSLQMLCMFIILYIWVGLVVGFGFFVVFYVGVLILFYYDLLLWQILGVVIVLLVGLDDVQYLLEDVLVIYLEVCCYVGMIFFGIEYLQFLVYWQVDDGSWCYVWLGQIVGSLVLLQIGLVELVNELYYSFGLLVVGVYVMGIVSLLYGMVLLSGLVIYLLKLFGDLFVLCLGCNLKQLWQDVYNVIGVFSLFFYLMFVVMGVLLCLVFVQMVLFNLLIYDGKVLQVVLMVMDIVLVCEVSGILVLLGSLCVLYVCVFEVVCV